MIAKVLELVSQYDRFFVPTFSVSLVNEVCQFLFLHDFVDGGKRDFFGDDVPEDDSPDRGLKQVIVLFDQNLFVQIDHSRIVGHANLMHIGKFARFLVQFRIYSLSGQVIEAENYVLCGNDDGFTVSRRQNIVCAHHKYTGFHLRFNGQWDMNGHLIAVKVCVKGRANQRMELDGFTLNQDGLKSLNSQTVEGRGSVQENGVFLDHILENIPNLRRFLFHQFLGAFNGSDVTTLFELVINEWFEKLQSHPLG